MGRANLRNNVEPGESGHGDVEEKNLRTQAGDLIERLPRVAFFADDLHRSRAFDPPAKRGADHGLVVEE
jgi:hypothetical protein